MFDALIDEFPVISMFVALFVLFIVIAIIAYVIYTLIAALYSYHTPAAVPKSAAAKAVERTAEEQLLTSTKLRRFHVRGVVEKHSDAGAEVIGQGNVIKEAESAQVLEDAWYRDMREAFPQGPDYNVEYHCTVTPVEDAPRKVGKSPHLGAGYGSNGARRSAQVDARQTRQWRDEQRRREAGEGARTRDEGFDGAGFAFGLATGIPISPSRGVSPESILGSMLHPTAAPARTTDDAPAAPVASGDAGVSAVPEPAYSAPEPAYSAPDTGSVGGDAGGGAGGGSGD